MAGSGSRVMKTGGLGLFLDPGGRPLGRLTTSMVAPSPPSEESLGFWAWLVGGVVLVGPPLLRPLSSSSEVCCWHSRGVEAEETWWKG